MHLVGSLDSRRRLGRGQLSFGDTNHVLHRLKFSLISRIGQQFAKILTAKILIPEFQAFVNGIAIYIASSGRGLGADATVKVLTAKIQKRPIHKNFQLYGIATNMFFSHCRSCT